MTVKAFLLCPFFLHTAFNKEQCYWLVTARPVCSDQGFLVLEHHSFPI